MNEEERYLFEKLEELQESGMSYDESYHIITERLDQIKAEEIKQEIQSFKRCQ